MNNHDVDELLQQYRGDFTPDVERGLASLHQRVGLVTSPAPGGAAVRRMQWRQFAAVAAAVALLLTAGWFLLRGDGPTVIVSPPDSFASVTLPDGTSVVLQQNSTLTYAADYGETDRSITLSGQGYFEVVPDAAVPFLARATDGTLLRVTGTTFNLRAEAEEFEVEVSEGSVLLIRDADEYPVGAKQCGMSRSGEKISVMDSPFLNRHAWRGGELRFDSASVHDVVAQLERTFRVAIELKAHADCDFPVSGRYASDDLPNIMSNIAKLGGGTYRSVAEDRPVHELSGFCKE